MEKEDQVLAEASFMLVILKIIEGSKKLATAEAVSFMEQYIEQIKKLSAVIDEMKTQE